MKKRFTEEQIVAILRDCQSGSKTIEQLCREHGVSQPTYHAWKRKYGSMNEPDVKRLRELEKENERLRRLLAERELAIDVMKEFCRRRLRLGEGEPAARLREPQERRAAGEQAERVGGVAYPLRQPDVVGHATARRTEGEPQAGSPIVPQARPDAATLAPAQASRERDRAAVHGRASARSLRSRGESHDHFESGGEVANHCRSRLRPDLAGGGLSRGTVANRVTLPSGSSFRTRPSQPSPSFAFSSELVYSRT